MHKTSKASKKRPGRRVSYKSSLVTYMDIMGFRGLVREKTASEISRILRILKETVAPIKGVPNLPGSYIKHFSDLALRIRPINDRWSGTVHPELLSLVHIQKELVEQKILVRGAITLGDIEKSYGLVYGPGLIRAYELEQEAVYPRMIVDPDLLDEVKRNSMLRHPDHDYKTEMRYIRELIRKDSDGFYFVDYLRAIESELDYPEIGYPQFLKTHRDYIVTSASRFSGDEGIAKKFEWLISYHNGTVTKRFEPSIAKQYLIRYL